MPGMQFETDRRHFDKFLTMFYIRCVCPYARGVVLVQKLYSKRK